MEKNLGYRVLALIVRLGERRRKEWRKHGLHRVQMLKEVIDGQSEFIQLRDVLAQSFSLILQDAKMDLILLSI